MFENVGGKIKFIATAVAWIGIISSVIGGMILLTSKDTILFGFLIITVGSIASWLSALTLYGFGQLIQNSDILVNQGRQKKDGPNSSDTVKLNYETFPHETNVPSCDTVSGETNTKSWIENVKEEWKKTPKNEIKEGIKYFVILIIITVVGLFGPALIYAFF